MSKLVDLQNTLEERRQKLAAVFEEAGPEYDFGKVKSLTGDDTAKAEAVRAMSTEMNDLADQVKAQADLEAIADGVQNIAQLNHKSAIHRGDAREQIAAPSNKTLGQLFVESVAYTGKATAGPVGPTATLDVGGSVHDIRATLMTTTAGWVPETTRTGRLVNFATRPVQVLDMIPMGRTIQNAVVYMEETTFTNNAAEAAEGGTYAESALALTEQTSPVRKIATFLPVTDEQLDDVAGLQDYVDNRLGFMLEQRLDSQIVVGNGTTPNLRGILNVVGIQTQAKGADPTPDAIYKAMTLIRLVGRAIPNGIIMHPTDWQDVKLLRTSDGVYIWGNPADNAPDRIWGLTVAQSDAITLNTAVVGDFQTHSQLVIRKDVEVQISNSHSTFFIEGKQAIRADMRVAFVVYRPTAFCTVTGV